MSSKSNGHNPLQWDCQRQGCFNVKKRPKIEIFADCLPRACAFTDVDGIVEVNGRLLILEWKSHESIPRGQRLLYSRWTAHGPATVLFVLGDAEDMTVEAMARAREGRIEDWQPADLDALRREIRDWAEWADRQAALVRT